MSRAEKRRAEREKAAKTPTYTFTQEQLDNYILNAIQEELNRIKKEATEHAANQAMVLLFTLPMKVMMDYYWPKSYQQRLPKFAERISDYYYKWQIGELDMDEMIAELDTYAGIKFVEEDVDG